MKAVEHTRYGSPEVLQLKEVATPTPADNEVLIRVHAAAVTTVDTIFRRGDQFAARLFTGPLRPKNAIPGSEFSGRIEAVGSRVERFKPGTAVFGSSGGFGAHAEYIRLPDSAALAEKPEGLTHAEAAAICEGALTALPFLRDSGKLQSGQTVLVIGASGSVGSAAVQLAGYLGANVTGVCSTANVELVRSLGAEAVIDYTVTDFARSGRTWDIIFDAIGASTFSRSAPALAPNGIYLCPVIGAGILLRMLWTLIADGKRARFAATGARPPADRARDLAFIRGLIDAGALKPVVDRIYPLDQIAAAHRHVETGHKTGNVVIAMAPDPTI